MNQTRVFLIFAWLAVATLLWMEWGKERDATSAPVTPVATTTTTAAGSSRSGTRSEPPLRRERSRPIP